MMGGVIGMVLFTGRVFSVLNIPTHAIFESFVLSYVEVEIMNCVMLRPREVFFRVEMVGDCVVGSLDCR